MRRILISVVLLSVLAFVPTGNAAVHELANSITGFSGTQGLNGWTYETLNNDVYTDMGWDSGASEWVAGGLYSGVNYELKQNATQMMKDKIGGGAMQGVGTVRRWTATSAVTDLTASGTYNVGYALTRIYTSSGYIGQPTAGGPATGSYSFSIPDMVAGDWVYVYMFCYAEAQDDPYDLVYQDLNMVINGVPEPATICLLSLGGLLLRRRKR
jgi:hypothetical protein